MGEPALKVAWVCLHLCSSTSQPHSTPMGRKGWWLSSQLRARVLRDGWESQVASSPAQASGLEIGSLVIGSYHPGDVRAIKSFWSLGGLGL